MLTHAGAVGIEDKGYGNILSGFQLSCLLVRGTEDSIWNYALRSHTKYLKNQSSLNVRLGKVI